MLKKILEEYNVATTALLANYWKNEAKSKENWPGLTIKQGKREKDLFKDANMQYFVNDDIKKEAVERLDKRMWLPLATRTRFFRHTIADAVKNKEVKQIIILGSGFDTLAARKIKYTEKFHANFIEIDKPEILNCKEKIYKQYNINKNAIYIGLDYVKENLIQQLINNGVNFKEATLILWEGNTFYLEKDDAIAILKKLAQHFEHLIITFDYMHDINRKDEDKLANEKSFQNTLEKFSNKKSPFKTFFAPNEIEQICKNLGIFCVNHKTASMLAREYDVDQQPYYTAETYSVATFEK